MKKKIINTDKAPAAVGPYSQAVRVGKLIYTAGQIPLNPVDGTIVTADENPTAVQTEQVLKNLTAVVEAAGSNLKNVVKVTVFLQDMGDFAEMNEVYARYFPKNPPARSAVEVAALPLGVRVEMEAVALRRKK